MTAGCKTEMAAGAAVKILEDAFGAIKVAKAGG